MGGAKNCPETPRQKMIGMMYLVLTAMLALNVSTDILNGFQMVDDSLFSTITSTEDRNQTMYKLLEQQKADKPEKYTIPYQEAMEMKQRSDSLFNFISNFKRDMAILAVGEEEVNSHDYSTGYAVRGLKGTSNLDVTGQYGINEGHGVELQKRVEEYRDYLLSILAKNTNPMDQTTVKKMTDQFNMLFTCDSLYNNHEQKMDTWVNGMFDGMVLNATITVLSKMQNDIRSTEGQMIQYLMGSADAMDLRVNKLQAYVIPKSDYVMRGAKYSAQIILAAIDSTQRPEYYVEGQRINDQGLYEVVASGSGVRKYKGQIAILSNTGEKQYLPFESEYTVGEPNATISNTEMNVMYLGYDNKFSVSVPGVSSDKVSLSASGASVTRKGDLWIIRPNESSKNVTVTVSATMDGKSQTMGQNTYKVKNLPDPSAFFIAGGKMIQDGEKISRNVALSDDMYLEASYGTDGILDINFKITEFTIFANSRTASSSSEKLTSKQKELIKSLNRNESFFITNIHAASPAGKDMKLKGSIRIILN